MIPNDFIQKVKESNNIVAVAAKYLPVKQKGRGHWACCPFHHEKTPSFSLNEQNQFYHCFGCGVSGNVISLVQHLENVDFVGAIEILAKNANLKMPELQSTPEQIERQRKRTRMYEIVEAARGFYVESINDTAKKYLHGRGVNDELIEKFNIGQSPDWDTIVKYLKNKGYTEAEGIEAGVLAKSQKGRVYDAMGERIVFSIFDLMGRCIGFTGRILPEKDNGEVAKYRNTAETWIFNKGEIVYGADVLKLYLRHNKVENLIVVEGNVDVISMVAAGFDNTLACMGTAFTEFHAKALKRFCDQIYMCFDGDKAGRAATLRALDILEREQLFVRVISLPTDTDPDSFIRKNGRQAFKDLMADAKPLTEYRTTALREAGMWEEKIQATTGHKPTPAPETPTPPKPPREPDTAYTRALNFVTAAKLHRKDYADKPLEFEIEIPDKKIADFTDEDFEKYGIYVGYDFNIDNEAKYYQDCVRYLLKEHLKKKRDETTDLNEKAELTRRIKCQ